MAVHVLKTIGTIWDAVYRGEKTFEVRKNDRFFQRGDAVILRRLSDLHDGFDLDDYSYRDLKFKIGWMLQGGHFGIEEGYCVFSLDPIAEETA